MPCARRLTSTLLVGAAIVIAACGPGDDDGRDGAEGSGRPASARCETNRAAGSIVYLTSFDYAASAAILDPIVAEAEGYFDELCLDVAIQPGFAPGNAATVVGGAAQISSAGSLGELVNNNVRGEAELVAIANYGKTAIEALLVRADGPIRALADLEGATIGVKNDIPYSIQNMLALNGVERSSLDEVLLEGFDPVQHFSLDIDALPVYKSNEPAQLDEAGFAYRVFDPLDYDIPSSFGVLFTTRDYLDEHRDAVTDFVRACYRAFLWSVDNPEEAVGHAIDLVESSQSSLTEQSERHRWGVESQIVLDSTPGGDPPGLVDAERVQAEVDALSRAGVFDEPIDIAPMIDTELGRSLWAGTELIWP